MFDSMNELLQGSAADIVKEAMIRCTTSLRLQSIRARLCAQLHDELLFEVAEGSVLSAARIVKQEMEQLGALDEGSPSLPPLPVSIVCGRSWGDLREIMC